MMAARGAHLALCLFTSILPLGLPLGLGTGCKSRTEPPAPRLHLRVVEIQATDATSPEEAPTGVVSVDDLRAACTAGLARAGIEVALSGAPRPTGDYHLRLELRQSHVEPSADTAGRGLLRATARGRLTTQQPPAGEPSPDITRFDQDAMAERPYTGAAPDAKAWVDHARRTAQDTAEALGSQLALLGADRQTLLQTLSRKDLDTDLRGVAIRLVGSRKEREAVPLLIGLLKDPEMEVRDKAIGALIEIGDRRAVKPLCASASFQDTFELGKILEAVATLGGDEARSYLEFVASGHNSEQIRAEARVALSHLHARERDGGAVAMP